MEPQLYQKMHVLQERHWWFVGQRFLLRLVLKRWLKTQGPLRILDAGCGPGAFLPFLKRYGWVAGVDNNLAALRFCQQDGHQPLCQGSLLRLPFKDATFDLIALFDVLYHRNIPHEAQALQEAFRCLKQGALAVLREPAFNSLWRKHDIVEHTARRFTLGEFRKKIEEAGFTVENIFYANTLLFPVAYMVKLKERFFEPAAKVDSDLYPLPAFFNAVCMGISCAESLLGQMIRFPFGVSIICVARKR